MPFLARRSWCLADLVVVSSCLIVVFVLCYDLHDNFQEQLIEAIENDRLWKGEFI